MLYEMKMNVFFSVSISKGRNNDNVTSPRPINSGVVHIWTLKS